jgi:hypothetical protein
LPAWGFGKRAVFRISSTDPIIAKAGGVERPGTGTSRRRTKKMRLLCLALAAYALRRIIQENTESSVLPAAPVLKASPVRQRRRSAK